MIQNELDQKRARLAERFGYVPCPALGHEKVGIARSVMAGEGPIHGVRCRPENGTTGWYIWAGDTFSEDPDFFLPIHVAHLEQYCPSAVPYLELPPGWRFLVAPGHEDVWFDPDVDLSALGESWQATPDRG